mmetsp:Transcript_42868/g.113522  ORF Transcript_42868/g.113522 Transcript_42868/m.113522 type:complete len:286 (-) Transcript_42868:11-868(-)
MLLRTDDGRHLHLRVVHGDAEIVDGHAAAAALARAQQDEIAHCRLHVPLDVPAHRIVDRHDAPTRHLETHRVRIARVEPSLHVGGVGVAPRAVVLRVLALGLRLGALGIELLGGAEARVGVALIHELLGELLVQARGHPLRLAVRSLGALHLGPLVPEQPEPAQVLQHALLRLAGAARSVSILDADDEVATLLLRGEPREERRARTAHVQRAGGRGREARPHAAVGVHAAADRNTLRRAGCARRKRHRVRRSGGGQPCGHCTGGCEQHRGQRKRHRREGERLRGG